KVFNNECQPKDLIGKVPPRWQTTGAWNTDKPDEPKRFEHGAGADSQVDWLRYRHLIPDPGRQTYRQELITDFLGYNTYREQGPHRLPAQNWVGDLMLEADVDVQQTQGELIFELSKGSD